MKDIVKNLLHVSAGVKTTMADDNELLQNISNAAALLISASKNNGTIYTCGNGGSACDAMHLAEELVSRFKRERPGIRAMHFLDPGIVTCWANDYDFDSVFERQVQTFCKKEDVLIIFSTSGESQNIIRAAKTARERGTKVIGLLGKGGGKAASHCDIAIVIPSNETERVQEAHITLVHIFCELLEA